MQKYGFVYIWYDRKKRMFYVGSHWGTEDDGYICSSTRMKRAYRRRPETFKRRVLKKVFTDRTVLAAEEQRYLDMIDPSQLGIRYYNLNTKNPSNGFFSHKHTESTRQKMSEAKKRNPVRYWQGRKRDPSTVTKISEKKRGVAQTDEHRAANSAKITELWKNAEWREKVLSARAKRSAENS